MTTQTPSNRQIQFLFTIALASLLILGTARIVLDSLKNGQSPFLQLLHLGNKHEVLRVPVSINDDDVVKEGCNVFEGNWVWDNISSRLYTEESCPYLVKQVTCNRNGRPDSLYQNWRWQPNACNLPRFDALKLLEVLRNKRLMFVGDSIQRGMFDSMVCLVQSVIPDGKKSLERIPPRKIFTAKVLPICSAHTNQNYCKNHKFGSPYNVQEYKVATAYRLALETWANWIETNINPRNQEVYFMSMSPTHLWSWEWKHRSEGNCFNESHPIHGSYWGTGSNLEIMEIVRDALEKVKLEVTLLNITQLSEYRKDGHTSVYGERKGKLLTREQRSDPKNFADCIHWCLPGVPDTWNEILYAHLLKNYQSKRNKLSPPF
ncbi:hypothetical protein RHMOL_Rhmol06G0269800 [Rhododendron molle]|uniref:Uncharacterized protein n=1 Tax=Rhododendron molle TaxID=49168 RepID=A0ACC0NIA9_RHOML|nr:hypothetical protein RHMOL_Rhmol06G0269800 [Rhododendron molle]